MLRIGILVTSMLLLIGPSLDTHGVTGLFLQLRIWNSLPLNLRSCVCTTTFKSLLKTYLMSQVFKD